MKAITLHGWNRKINVWHRNRNRKPHTIKPFKLSLSGYAREPKVVRQNQKRA
jgi:hypothetical protein